MNPKVNGQMQHEWDWLIAIYLFLGGLGSGAYAIAVINSFLDKGNILSPTAGLWIACPALLIGSFFLIADLGAPSRSFLAGLKPQTSWIARGFWIISIFMGLSFLHLILHQFTNTVNTAGGRTLLSVISIAGLLFAFGTMAYTGMLLGGSKGIPFWRSSAEPVVFVFSALVTGVFAIMIGIMLFNPVLSLVKPLQALAFEAAALLLLLFLAVLFFLHGAHHHPDSKESGERIIRNKMFIVGFLIFGLVVPLILMLTIFLSQVKTGGSGIAAMAVIGAVLGLMGGLILRRAVLISGALPTLTMAGFEFRRIHRPKEPKPGIGLMPPGNPAK